MQNVVKQYFPARMCIVGVVVTKESNMASYFPKAGNVNGSNADVCSDVAGPSSSVSGELFYFSSCYRSRAFTIFPLLALLAATLDLSVTTTTILPFEACFVIMHTI